MLYMISVFVPIIIYTIYLQNDKNSNDCHYILKRLRNKGINGMTLFMSTIGNAIIEKLHNHTELIKITSRFRGRRYDNTQYNLKKRKKPKLLLAALTAMSMQIQASH